MTLVNFMNIPAELKTVCQFCVWRFEKRNGKKTKIPYNPKTGEKAKSNDARTFSDFRTAAATYAIGGYDGLGICVGSGIGAFDIDHCIREDGTLNDVAAQVLSVFGTCYVEKSPSGFGLRGFFHVPGDYVFDKTVYYINNRSKGLEVYMPGATNRFVTVTGDVYRTGDIPDNPEAMTVLLDSMMRRARQVTSSHIEHRSYLTDEAVVEHALKSPTGDKFQKYMDGDWQEMYDNQSDADMSFISMLAFWCGCDEEQMDRIYRGSGMMRPKWDRKQAGTTYGALTIRNAVNSCTSIYLPVNAQDIVEEEFSCLDGEDVDFQPDFSKLSLTLEEMAPHSNPRYGREEIGIGNMFADYFKPIARYNKERKLWYVYDGTVWQEDLGSLKVAELAKMLADKLYVFALTITEEDARKRFIDRVRKLQLRKHRDTMVKEATSVYPIPMVLFDNNTYLFNCRNGTLDLRSMEFREHRPEDFLTKCSEVVYDRDADCPRWKSFMDEIMQGDTGRIRYLQKAMGYALSGDTSLECLFILYGATTRNGKGTTMETFLKIMGEYGKNADPSMLAMKFTAQSNGPSEELARLAGARFVNISEPEKKITLDAGLVKRLTGNDTITARFLHENSFEFQTRFKVFVNTNHLPNITDLTLFESGRIKIIPFNRHFEEHEQDKGLKAFFALPENQSGIFNWVLEGYQMYRRERLEMPKSVLEATQEYRMESDKISQFASACLVEAKGSELRSQAIYNRYKEWCSENNYRPEGQGNFKKSFLKNHIEVRRRPKDGGEKTTLTLDVEFVKEDDDTEFSPLL